MVVKPNRELLCVLSLGFRLTAAGRVCNGDPQATRSSCWSVCTDGLLPAATLARSASVIVIQRFERDKESLPNRLVDDFEIGFFIADSHGRDVVVN